MIEIQMFENGKSDIVLQKVKGSIVKRTPFIVLISERNLKLSIIVLVILNKGIESL